jgi:hypothetical protein
MKKSDLYREWARVLDMCEGTNVKPEYCWKLMGVLRDREPDLGASPNNYEFALAILEDKPVFAGDKLYFPNGTPCIIEDNELLDILSVLSWRFPQNKTFMLNGEQLPCPEKSNEYELRIVGFEENNYKFIKSCDIKKVENAINKLLKESTGNGE